MPSSSRSRRARPRARVRLSDFGIASAPRSQTLFRATDGGRRIRIEPHAFIPDSRTPGWGNHVDSFLARNNSAFRALEIEPTVSADREGIHLEIRTSLKAGAVPLISAFSGKVAGGVIVEPRFGWPGVGRVLAKTGWGSGPEFLSLPFVPGSGREIPPWVIAGPVLRRLADLIESLKPGYEERIETRTQPRGQILWNKYLRRQMPSGLWHHLPCKFSELSADPFLRQAIRWIVEKLQEDLVNCPARDETAANMLSFAASLHRQVGDVPSRRPTSVELERYSDPLASCALRQGLQAMGWVIDERGLGGGRTSDGIAWVLALEQLWERYVEVYAGVEASRTGGKLRIGRKGETTIPLPWSSSSHRAIGHLVPDIVVEGRDGIEIIDAKYKPHFADLNYSGWHALTEELKHSLRADVHQVLAYSSVFGANADVTSTLVYPVSDGLYEELKMRDQDIVLADIPTRGPIRKLRLRALPFSGPN